MEKGDILMVVLLLIVLAIISLVISNVETIFR